MANSPPPNTQGSGAHAARAQIETLIARLHNEEELDHKAVYRGHRTLAALLDSLGIRGPIPVDLRAGLSELITALEVRVGEEIDSGSDESAYDLGRSIEIINRWRRRSGEGSGTK